MLIWLPRHKKPLQSNNNKKGYSSIVFRFMYTYQFIWYVGDVVKASTVEQ